MKKIIALAAVVAATVATPALAHTSFTGLRAEATVGADDVTNLNDVTDVTYGAAIGLDAPVANGALVVGVEGSVDNVFERKDIAAAVRVGVPVGRVMPYAKVGYNDFRGMSGLRVGGGVEYALSHHLFTGVEYRYTDFEGNAGRHQGLVKLGFRF